MCLLLLPEPDIGFGLRPRLAESGRSMGRRRALALRTGAESHRSRFPQDRTAPTPKGLKAPHIRGLTKCSAWNLTSLSFRAGLVIHPLIHRRGWGRKSQAKREKQKLVSFLCAGVPPPGPTPTLNLLYTAAPPWVSTTSPCRLFPGAVREIAESCFEASLISARQASPCLPKYGGPENTVA